MDDDAGVQWSELPPELWLKVAKHLHSPIDAVRFRSVCRSWRSSVPPSPQISPPLRLRFPSPTTALNRRRSNADAFLSESTAYRLAPLGHEPPNPNRNGRLVKLEKSELGKMRYLHPLSNRVYHNFECFPKDREDFNLLDVRIEEVARSYSLKLADGVRVPGIAKLVVFPEPTDAEKVGDCLAIAVLEKGKLGFARSGDDKWILIHEQNHHFDDVIVYNRQIYAVDRWGTVFWIDSSLRLLQFSPLLIGFGHRKHLAECGGELLVIDQFLEEERPINVDRAPPPVAVAVRSPRKTVGFKAYKLDQEWGRWVEVKNLENRSIVLGNDGCFCVDASDFEGCVGNCIYYCDLNDNEFSMRCSSGAFDLEGGRTGNILVYPGLVGIFCPPPIWLSSSFLPSG